MSLNKSKYIEEMVKYLMEEYRFGDTIEAYQLCIEELNNWLEEEGIEYGDSGYSWCKDSAQITIDEMVSHWEE